MEIKRCCHPCLTLQVSVAGMMLSIMQLCGLFMGRRRWRHQGLISIQARFSTSHHQVAGCQRLFLHFEMVDPCFSFFFDLEDNISRQDRQRLFLKTKIVPINFFCKSKHGHKKTGQKTISLFFLEMLKATNFLLYSSSLQSYSQPFFNYCQTWKKLKPHPFRYKKGTRVTTHQQKVHGM